MGRKEEEGGRRKKGGKERGQVVVKVKAEEAAGVWEGKEKGAHKIFYLRKGGRGTHTGKQVSPLRRQVSEGMSACSLW